MQGNSMTVTPTFYSVDITRNRPTLSSGQLRLGLAYRAARPQLIQAPLTSRSIPSHVLPA